MVLFESVDDVRREVLSFLARMGEATWSSEIQKIKKTNNVWEIEIKKTFPKGEVLCIEMDADTGKVIYFEKK